MTEPKGAMIFAAGFGTRMGVLTKDMPKPLIKVAGRPLIDHTLDLTQHLSPVVVNTHYLGNQISDHLSGSGVKISHEDAILETGGGLKNALSLLGEGPVCTMNSDAIWVGGNPFDVLASHWQPDMGALLLMKHVDNTHGRSAPGDFAMDKMGRLTRSGDYVYLGAQIIQTESVANFPDTAFSLNVIWDELIEKGRVYGCVYDGQWCDVGRPENITAAESMLESTCV